jgi:hypothetical protein
LGTHFLKAIVNKKWKSTILEEMDLISHNQFWQLMKLPPKKRPITIKWIYKVKNDYNGKPSKYKARIVVKGFE